MYKNKVWVLYSGVHMNVAGLQGQHGFEFFFQFVINVSQRNFLKSKTTNKFIEHVAVNFVKRFFAT